MAEPLICWLKQINDCSIRVSQFLCDASMQLQSKVAAGKNEMVTSLK